MEGSRWRRQRPMHCWSVRPCRMMAVSQSSVGSRQRQTALSGAVPCSACQRLPGLACTACQQEVQELLWLLGPMHGCSMRPCTLQHLGTWLQKSVHGIHRTSESAEGLRGRCGWQQSLLVSVPLQTGAMQACGGSCLSQAVLGWAQAALLIRQEGSSPVPHAQGVHVALLTTA